MKILSAFLITLVLCSSSINGQDHPFDYLDKTDSKAELLSGFANAIEYASSSPKLKLGNLRGMVSKNSFLTEKEKQAILVLIDAEDGSITNRKSSVEYFDECIKTLDDSLSLLHAYIAIRRGEVIAFDNTKGYKTEVENLFPYRSETYPSWLHGYLYFALSLSALQQKDYERFISYADTASINLAANKHYAMQGLLHHTVGDELYYRSEDSLAIVNLQKALKIELVHDLDYLRMKTLTDLAALDRLSEDYEACVDKQYQVIRLAEALRDTSFIIEGKMRLSVTMSAQEGKQLIEAEKVLNEAQVLALEIGDESRYGRTFGYLGGVYLNMEKYGMAISNFKKEIELNGERNKDKLIVSYLELAACYKEIGNTDSTYIAVAKSNEYNGGRNLNYQQYGELILTDYYIKKGEYKKAIAGAELGLEMAGDHEKGMKSTALNQLRRIYEAKGNYKKAYEYFIKFDQVEQVLENEDLSLKISEARLESTYEAEKKIMLANSEKEKAVVQARQRQFMYLAGLAAIVAAFMAGLYFLLRSKNNQINSKNKELHKLNNVKDQLFQIIGHDLKKPVISFRNVSQNLNYLIEKGDMDRVKKLGEEIDNEGKSLYKLTDNLLHWALLQKDVLTINPVKVDVHKAVENNIDIFKNVFLKKKLSVVNSLSPETYALVDENSLDTIIRNVLDNAIKFTPEGGEINFKSEGTGSKVSITVSDTGVGMDSKLRNSILIGDNLKSEKGTNQEQGSGLGMTIIKSMIEKNEGALKIESEKDKGSVISIILKKAV